MTVTIDKAGRVVLPKALRSRLDLNAGDTLQLASEGGQIVLKPVRRQAPLKKEHGIWVYHGEATGMATDVSIPELIERVRGSRLKDLLG
jgi:AbrB family looped-hinge helix DNA binding protein